MKILFEALCFWAAAQVMRKVLDEVEVRGAVANLDSKIEAISRVR